MGKESKEKDRKEILLDRKDRKIKTQEEAIKHLSLENEDLKKEIEKLKSDLEIERSLPKGSIKKTKEMMEQLEFKKQQYEDLISDLEYMKKQYQEYLTEFNELKSTYRDKLEENIKEIEEIEDTTLEKKRTGIKNKKLVSWEKGFFSK